MDTVSDEASLVLQSCSYEFVHIRALCDEIMESLCQAKALLEPINQEEFFSRLETEVLRHYFYAIETIIDSALTAKDQINKLIDVWEEKTKSRRKL
ncbi:MAG: hypothetical protein KDH94_03080 [Coxiellaceae bacterium]|nr:hypothetical protein [Coxiellaceae bacterium]